MRGSTRPERLVLAHCWWPRLLDADGDDLHMTYRHMLEDFARQPGLLGVVFRKAQNRISRTPPRPLRRSHLDGFVASYLPGRPRRVGGERAVPVVRP